MDMAINALALGKRYSRRWALKGCTVAVPAGRTVGLIGPNGAGKTTLLSLAVGTVAPTAGTIAVLGARPASSPKQVARVGYMAQSPSLYARLSIGDHLRLGSRLNPRWDGRYAAGRIERLGLTPGQTAGSLSGGQRAQLALTMALAKRPDLLVLDEPVASLDPLARREFLDELAAATTQRELSVVLSSHLVADVERICDYLIVLGDGEVQVSGTIAELLAGHRDGQSLEELVLSHLARAAHHPRRTVTRDQA